MILAFIEEISSADNILLTAKELSVALKKELGVLYLVDDKSISGQTDQEIKNFLQKNHIADAKIIIEKESIDNLSEICEELEASFLIIQTQKEQSGYIKKRLKACRGLRIPYIFYKSSFPVLKLLKVLLPVTFLEEEYEKAQFAAAFGRFCNSKIDILLANDYGSKAAATANKMETLFDKFNLNYSRIKAKGDSFKIEKEAVQLGEKEYYGIILLSASREYGMDDILFGPKELHLIKRSDIPLLLVNPRGDLYALCD